RRLVPLPPNPPTPAGTRTARIPPANVTDNHVLFPDPWPVAPPIATAPRIDTDYQEAVAPVLPAETRSEWGPDRLIVLLTSLWLVSAAIVGVVILLRVRRFRRLLVWQLPAPGWLRQLVNELAAKLRVWPPLTLVLPGIATPFLWCLGRPKLLLPAALMEQLGPASRRGIIAHELAHLRRRDHWVRWLEFPALCLWWWNPLFWIVRRQLRANAELACDAWVVGTLPGSRRAYAEALIEVSRLGSQTTSPMPGFGVGGSDRQGLEGRLAMIMRDGGAYRVPAAGLLAIGLLALLVLPAWSPGQKDDPKPAEKSETPKESAQDRALEMKLKQARVDGKYG